MALCGKTRCRLPILTARSALIGLLVSLQLGCASFRAPKIPLSERVAIVTAIQPTAIAMNGFIIADGTNRTTKEVFTSCLNGWLACDTSACGPFMIFWLGFCSGVASGTSITNAALAPSDSKLQPLTDSLPELSKMGSKQELIRDQVVAAARSQGKKLKIVPQDTLMSFSDTRDKADYLLEAAVVRISLDGVGSDPLFRLSIIAHARLIRTSDNKEVVSNDFVHEGDGLKLSEWTSNEAKRLSEALNSGYRSLGEKIIESIFVSGRGL